MPASSAIIGRVAVKVLPDVEDFRRDAERKLDAIERQMTVKVPTDIDMTGAKRGFLEGLRAINQENRNNDNRKIRFHTTISNDGMNQAVTNARRALQVRADQERIEFKAADLDAGFAKLHLDQQSLDDVEDQLERWRAGVSPIKVEIELELNTSVASARLAVLTRPRTVPIIPVIDNAALLHAGTALAALSGARVLSTYFSDMGRAIGKLDKSVPLIASLATAVAGLSAFGLAAASNLFAVGTSLAQIGPAALVLPGILAGIGIGVGVMVAAFKDFGTIFPDVKAKFSEMQDLISGNFWKEAQAPMREMLDRLLPQLSSGFGKTATQLGGFFAGISDGVTDVLSKRLDGMFADLAESIDIATAGSGALVGIFTTLGEVGAGYLPRLATYFVDITTQFDNFLTKSKESGALTDWIDTALVNLQALGSSLASVGGILAGIGQAALAGGGSGLTTLADTLNSIQATVEGTTFQITLTRVFAAAHEAISRLTDISGPAVSRMFETLANTLSTILPVVGDTLGTLVKAVATALAQPALSTGLVNLFLSIKTGVLALTPAIAFVGEAFTALMPVVGALAEILGPILAAAFAALSQVVVDLAPHFQNLIHFLGEGLLAAINLIAPAITGLSGFFAEHETVAKVLAGVIGGVLVTAYTLMGVQAVINSAKVVLAWIANTSAATAGAAGHQRSIAQVIAGWVLMAAQALLNGIKVVAVWTVQIVATAVAATARVVAQIAIQIAAWVLMGVQSLLAAAKVAAAWLIAMGPIGLVIIAVVGLVALIIANWDTIKRVTVELWNKVKDATSAAWEALKGFVSRGISALVDLFLNFTGPGLVIKHWDSIKNTVSSGVEAVGAFVRTLPGKITAALGNAGSILVGAGRAIIDGLLRGITGAFGKVKETLGSLTNMLPDWKGPARKDSVLLFDAGSLIINGLIDGMESQYSGVRRSLEGLTKDVAGTVMGSPQLAAMQAGGGASGGLGTIAAASAVDGGAASSKTFIYNAAPGNSLSSEEELFAAASRSRMAVGW